VDALLVEERDADGTVPIRGQARHRLSGELAQGEAFAVLGAIPLPGGPGAA
jgi:hypothetical protein